MARRDTSSAVGGTEWIQTGLVPPDHIEAVVRVLYTPQQRRARYQIELSNPNTRELLAMRSRPFHDSVSFDEAFSLAAIWLREAVRVVCDPDPF